MDKPATFLFRFWSPGRAAFVFVAAALLCAASAGLAQTLYVTGGSQTVSRVEANGTVSLFATLPAGSFPRDLTFDNFGNLYVLAGAGISKITPGGSVSPFVTLPDFSNSFGLTIDSAGNLYTTSQAGGNKVLKITPGGVVSAFTFTTINTPLGGLAFDAFGNLYASASSRDIYKIAPDGSFITFVTLPLPGTPDGLVFDSSGNLYAVKDDTSVITRITPGGVGSSFAALPGNSIPYSLDRDASGNFYVAAHSNGTIYKVSPDGLTVTPFANVPQAYFIAVQGVPAPFATFLSTYFPNGSTGDADPDGDGLSNAVEFILGDDPTVASTAMAPVFAYGGGSLVYAFNAIANPGGLTWTVQTSTDLQAWTPVMNGSNGATITATGTGTYRAVTATVPAGGGKTFIRLLVTGY